jgi:hypothetical protein
LRSWETSAVLNRFEAGAEIQTCQFSRAHRNEKGQSFANAGSLTGILGHKIFGIEVLPQEENLSAENLSSHRLESRRRI